MGRIKWHMCVACDKRGYDSQEDAERVRKGHLNAEALHVYRCPSSRLYHIGHRPGWRRITRPIPTVS